MLTTTDDYAAQSIQETISSLQTDAAIGLTSTDVSKRINRYGYNEIEEK